MKYNLHFFNSRRTMTCRYCFFLLEEFLFGLLSITCDCYVNFLKSTRLNTHIHIFPIKPIDKSQSLHMRLPPIRRLPLFRYITMTSLRVPLRPSSNDVCFWGTWGVLGVRVGLLRLSGIKNKLVVFWGG
jgi:hypothetical protein